MQQAERNARNFSDIGEEMGNSFQRNMGNAFSDFILGAKNAEQAIRAFGASFAEEMVKIATNKLAAQLFSGLVSFLTPGAPAPGSASFIGPMQPKAIGGLIRGGSGVRDDVPIAAMSGEYILPRAFVQKVGAHNLDNAIQGYSGGGVVAPPIGGASGGTTVNISVSSDGASKQASVGATRASSEAMAKDLEVAVLQIVAKHSRPGNSIWKMNRNRI